MSKYSKALAVLVYAVANYFGLEMGEAEAAQIAAFVLAVVVWAVPNRA